MNTKTFLSACLLSLSLLSCQTQELPQQESCPVDELPVILPNIPPLAEAEPVLAPASVPVAPAPAPKATPTQEESEIRLVVSPHKKPMIALQEATEKALPKGKSEWVSKKGTLAVRREVELSLLPEATTAWVGQAVKLYKADGSFCQANVTGVALLAQLQVYDDNPDKNSASKMFKLSQERGGVRVVAALDIDSCDGAVFARLSSLPDPNIVVPEDASKELRTLVLPAMRKLSAYKTVQARYLEHQTQQGPLNWGRWENLYDASPEVLTLQTKTRQLVIATAQQENGCGDFYGGLFALWELKADGSLTLLFQGEEAFVPDFALDVNGDQSLEFFQTESWRQLLDGQYKIIDEMDVPFQEDVCSC
jgi:hypothetical protein